MSPDAKRLLRAILELHPEHGGPESGYVPDELLWDMVGVGYEAYVEAAEELVYSRLAGEAGRSDRTVLEATPAGYGRGR